MILLQKFKKKIIDAMLYNGFIDRSKVNLVSDEIDIIINELNTNCDAVHPLDKDLTFVLQSRLGLNNKKVLTNKEIADALNNKTHYAIRLYDLSIRLLIIRINAHVNSNDSRVVSTAISSDVYNTVLLNCEFLKSNIHRESICLMLSQIGIYTIGDLFKYDIRELRNYYLSSMPDAYFKVISDLSEFYNIDFFSNCSYNEFLLNRNYNEEELLYSSPYILDDYIYMEDYIYKNVGNINNTKNLIDLVNNNIIPLCNDLSNFLNTYSIKSCINDERINKVVDECVFESTLIKDVKESKLVTIPSEYILSLSLDKLDIEPIVLKIFKDNYIFYVCDLLKYSKDDIISLKFITDRRYDELESLLAQLQISVISDNVCKKRKIN